MPIIQLYNLDKPILRPELLLHPNIPKPLHELSPRVIKGKKWWDEERQKAYIKSNYYCLACGVHKTEAKFHEWLEAHECYNIDYEKHTMTFIEVVSLCHMCHSFIHDGRLNKLLENRQITKKDYKKIIAYGNRILRRAKLKQRGPYVEDNNRNWSKWVLILDGKRYKGKFANYESWLAYFGKKFKYK